MKKPRKPIKLPLSPTTLRPLTLSAQVAGGAVATDSCFNGCTSYTTH